jgi:hypothetical protein
MTDAFEPIDDFVRRVEVAAGGNQHAIIGTLSCGKLAKYLIEVAVARAQLAAGSIVISR